MLINVKMPTIVGILTFMSKMNSVLSRDEYEKSFTTLGPDSLTLLICFLVLDMSQTQPTSMKRAKEWSPEAEEAYRFQTAGYRDEIEYRQLKQNTEVLLCNRW